MRRKRGPKETDKDKEDKEHLYVIFQQLDDLDVIESLTESMQELMQTEDRYEELRKKEAEERKNVFGFDPNEGGPKRKRRDSNELTVGPEKCKKGHKLVAFKRTPLLQPNVDEDGAYNQVTTAICKFKNCKKFDKVEPGQSKEGLNLIDLTAEIFYACQYENCLDDVFAVHQECFGGP